LKNHKNVIDFPQPWTFWDYGEGDRNYIAEWYAGLSEEAQGTFDDILKQTKKIENPKNWGTKPLVGGKLKEEKLFELQVLRWGHPAPCDLGLR